MENRKNIISEAKSLYKAIKEREKKLKDILAENAGYDRQIEDCVRELEKEQLTQKLKDISVDELSQAKLGIRVSLLKEAGLNNIWDLKNKTVSQLEAINGIGTKTATNIVSAVNQITKGLSEDIDIHIDADNPSKLSDKLVKLLYKQQRAKRLEERTKKQYQYLKDELTTKIKGTLPARNSLLWYLTPEEKKKVVIQKLDELKKLTGEGFFEKTDDLISEQYENAKAKHDDYWKDFKNNSAGYYATVIKTQNSEKKRKKQLSDSQVSAVRNGMPEELAIAVSEVELNLNGFVATLYPYQEYGVKYILKQGAVLLGDDMGLGKTIQAIASMVAVKNSGGKHFLVVCPASVIINWDREIKKFSNFETSRLHGKSLEEEASRWIEEGGVAVTTYESLAKVEVSSDFKIDMLVVDEAHYIKNPKASRTANVLKFRQLTDRVLFMSGTPLENRVSEMCFLIGCLQPEVAKSISESITISMAGDFRRKISGVYFRRTKEDVLDQLPQKVEMEEWLELTEKEFDLYCDYVNEESFMNMRQTSWKVEKGEYSSKFLRLKELIEAYYEEKRKVIVFSFFVNTINFIEREYEGRVFGPISGSVSPAERQKIIDEFTQFDGPALLLSQIQAGGTGLNIQAASVIIFCEPQLKPSIEEQAIARAYRIGQNNTVMVHRLLSDNTVDEQIVTLLESKRELFDAFADISESGQDSLVSLQVKGIIDKEKEKIQLK